MVRGSRRVGKVASLPLLDAELVGPPYRVVLAPGACVCVCAHPVRVSGVELAFLGKRGLFSARATCAALFVRPVRSRMICSRLPPRWGRDPHPPTAPARRP